jgi:hypothetical protein
VQVRKSTDAAGSTSGQWQLADAYQQVLDAASFAE